MSPFTMFRNLSLLFCLLCIISHIRCDTATAIKTGIMINGDVVPQETPLFSPGLNVNFVINDETGRVFINDASSNIVNFGDFKALSGVDPVPPFQIQVAGDGNVFVSDSTGRVGLQSGTRGIGDVKLQLQNNGQLTITAGFDGSVVWANGVLNDDNFNRIINFFAQIDNAPLITTPTLNSFAMFKQGTCMASPSNTFKLCLIPGGNLISVNRATHKTVFQSAGIQAVPAITGTVTLTMQMDGNIGIFDSRMNKIFSSGTATINQCMLMGCELCVKDNGDVVIQSVMDKTAVWVNGKLVNTTPIISDQIQQMNQEQINTIGGFFAMSAKPALQVQQQHQPNTADEPNAGYIAGLLIGAFAGGLVVSIVGCAVYRRSKFYKPEAI